jgi:hypothetical protein
MRAGSLLCGIVALALCGPMNESWAYTPPPSEESKDGAKGCKDQKFSGFTPKAYSQSDNNVEVKPKSEFSFLATEGFNVQSLTVTVKGESVPVAVTKVEKGYQVAGKLPDSVKGAFARINITGLAHTECEKVDGWLLKVGK